MLNGFSILSLFLISGCALIIALWPLRQRRIVWLLAPLLCCAAGLAYWHWGSWQAQTKFTQHTLREKEAEKLLQTLKSPDILIAKLQTHLQKHPGSARGWYLLGRLYASQHLWEKAHQAFAKAYQFNPNNELIVVNYAQSLLNTHQQQDADQARSMLKKLLETHPQQADALMLLAIDAERRHVSAEALLYWRRLLLLVPDASPEAETIRKRIQELSL